MLEDTWIKHPSTSSNAPHMLKVPYLADETFAGCHMRIQSYKIVARPSRIFHQRAMLIPKEKFSLRFSTILRGCGGSVILDTVAWSGELAIATCNPAYAFWTTAAGKSNFIYTSGNGREGFIKPQRMVPTHPTEVNISFLHGLDTAAAALSRKERCD